jgi:D-alanine-D-alanine ligase-like ATP-grasp enzyme
MTQKRVGILRGGTGEDYTSSLQVGADLISFIIENLADKYKIVDILVDRDGVWHINGIQTQPSELMHRVDVVWNTSHSNASTILKQFSIPTICATSFAHGIGGHRAFLQQHIEDLDINMPRHIVFPLYQPDFDGPVDEYASKKAQEVFRKFAGPWIVRTLTHDSSAGVHVAKTLPELAQAIEDILVHKKSILVEELIAGQIVPVHSVQGFRGEEVYTLPLGNITFSVKEKIVNLAKKLHQHLGGLTYMKSNFLLTPKGKVYLTGVSFHPNVKKTSHLASALESVGAKMHHFVEHMIEKVS